MAQRQGKKDTALEKERKRKQASSRGKEEIKKQRHHNWRRGEAVGCGDEEEGP